MIVDPYTYLLVDEKIIASSDNTSFIREEAFKHADNPIVDHTSRDLFLGQEGYRIWVKCICRHEGRYRMWYSFQPKDAPGYVVGRKKTVSQDKYLADHLAYAESDDGLNWKPVKLKGGKNTLRITDREDISSAGMMHDVQDKEYPFKAVIIRKGDVSGVNPAFKAKYPYNRKLGPHGSSGWFVWGLARSKDGFDWELPTHEKDMVDASIEGPSVYRALDGGYVISNQMITVVGDIQWRKVKGWVTYDQESADRLPGWIFSLPDHLTFVDPRYLLSTHWTNTPWVQSHVLLVPAIKGSSMISLHGYLYGATGAETYAQTADVGLAVSDTGYLFGQVWPFRPFIQRGERGRWDHGLVAQQAMVETNDKTYMYYVASDVGNAAGCHYYLGVAHVDKDRFGYHVLRVFRDYRQPKKRRGEIVLNPITLPGKPKLTVNASHVTKHRTVKIELRDPDTGKVIPGFSFSKCRPVTRDSVRAKVQWEKADVAKLAGREVTIAIELFAPDCQYADQHSPRVYGVSVK